MFTPCANDDASLPTSNRPTPCSPTEVRLNNEQPTSSTTFRYQGLCDSHLSYDHEQCQTTGVTSTSLESSTTDPNFPEDIQTAICIGRWMFAVPNAAHVHPLVIICRPRPCALPPWSVQAKLCQPRGPYANPERDRGQSSFQIARNLRSFIQLDDLIGNQPPPFHDRGDRLILDGNHVHRRKKVEGIRKTSNTHCAGEVGKKSGSCWRVFFPNCCKKLPNSRESPP